MKALGIALMVVATVFGLGGLWCWALFGMTYEVGQAVFWTAAAGFVGGAASLATWDANR